MKVGGRDFNQSKLDVEQAMHGEDPEEVRKYVVEVNGQAFPPKQVLARATAWERQSFTTMEAQRVLNKLGFVCREAGKPTDGKAWLPYPGKPESPELLGPPGTHRATVIEESIADLGDRLKELEAAHATALEAIAGLSAKVKALEGS